MNLRKASCCRVLYSACLSRSGWTGCSGRPVSCSEICSSRAVYCQANRWAPASSLSTSVTAAGTASFRMAGTAGGKHTWRSDHWCRRYTLQSWNQHSETPTVLDALSSFVAVLVEEAYAADDQRQLSQLLFFVLFQQRHEGRQLWLWKDALQSRCNKHTSLQTHYRAAGQCNVILKEHWVFCCKCCAGCYSSDHILSPNAHKIRNIL